MFSKHKTNTNTLTALKIFAQWKWRGYNGRNIAETLLKRRKNPFASLFAPISFNQFQVSKGTNAY